MIFHAETGFFINKMGYFAEKNIVKTNESIIKKMGRDFECCM